MASPADSRMDRSSDEQTEPGVVLVWHERGEVAHAVVTVGDGWVLNKPSQSWSSPTMVWTVRGSIDNWRLPGTRLSRYRLNR